MTTVQLHSAPSFRLDGKRALIAGAGRGTNATLDALLQVTPDLAAGTPSDDVCLLALRRR